jgi:hypothetical protein
MGCITVCHGHPKLRYPLCVESGTALGVSDYSKIKTPKDRDEATECETS